YHHLRAGRGLLEPLAGDGVDAGIGRGSDDLMAATAQNGDGLRADQAGAADDDDLHDLPPLSMTGDRMQVRITREHNAKTEGTISAPDPKSRHVHVFRRC